MKEKCMNCSENKRCRESYISWVFFIIGLIATAAIRVVTVLMHIDPLYGKLAWYTGVGGFFLFFLYRYNIIKTRSDLILRNKLTEKIEQHQQLSADDYNVLEGIMCSLNSKKERINFMFIFVLSAITLLIALYIDIFLV